MCFLNHFNVISPCVSSSHGSQFKIDVAHKAQHKQQECKFDCNCNVPYFGDKKLDVVVSVETAFENKAILDLS